METALRGAAAGVLGGLAISLVEREIVSRLAGGERHHSRWDVHARRGLHYLGVDVGDRGAIVAGVATQLVYAAALGAGYAVLREPTKHSRAGRMLLDGALTYAASLVFPDRPTPKRRGRKMKARRSLVESANPAAIFTRATTMSLGALLR